MKSLTNLATFDNMLDDRTPYLDNSHYQYFHIPEDMKIYHIPCKIVELAVHATTRIYKHEHML
jgi:hypothetical protein